MPDSTAAPSLQSNNAKRPHPPSTPTSALTSALAATLTSSPTSARSSRHCYDRFVPGRSPASKAYLRSMTSPEAASGTKKSTASSAGGKIGSNQNGFYHRLLAAAIHSDFTTPASARHLLRNDGNADQQRVLDYTGSSPAMLSLRRPSETPNHATPFSMTVPSPIGTSTSLFLGNDIFGGRTHFTLPASASSILRPTISTNPVRILDAPNLDDDFYLNVLDWSSTNFVAVGLASEVFYWNASTSETRKLCRMPGATDRVASISWSPKGNQMCIGTKHGKLDLYDIETGTRIRQFAGHCSRVGVISWANTETLSTGSRDHQIIHHDVRDRSAIAIIKEHKQEVCGLKWDQLAGRMASGGNDNQLLVWEGFNPVPVARYQQHTAAVKAVAWSPHQSGLLVSGGGTADRTIRFWNIKQPEVTSIRSISTTSQVCTLVWSPHANEVLSTHGFTEHHLSLWHYPSLQCMALLHGHQQRVLYQALSPDGTTVVTGSGDETLRFWSVFRRTTLRNGSYRQNLAPMHEKQTMLETTR